MRPERAGFSLLETITVILLSALVIPGLWAVMANQRAASERLRERSERIQTSRIVRTVLFDELGAGSPGRDWSVRAPGVVPLRAFRGWGVVCGQAGDSALFVEYRGLRLPDPSKDSLLVLEGDGEWSAVELQSRTSRDQDCAGSHRSVEVLRTKPTVRDPVLVRVFERGEYHLTGGALRYLRGLAGRQPLTLANLDPDGTGIAPIPGGAIAEVTLAGPGDEGWSRATKGNRGGR